MPPAFDYFLSSASRWPLDSEVLQLSDESPKVRRPALLEGRPFGVTWIYFRCCQAS